jgi:hypothetical protein
MGGSADDGQAAAWAAALRRLSINCGCGQHRASWRAHRSLQRF